jgi:hypothetical protein
LYAALADDPEIAISIVHDTFVDTTWPTRPSHPHHPM